MRASKGDAQAQFILYLMHTKKWGISSEDDSLTREEMTDRAQHYLHLAADQMCPFALYQILKNYNVIAEEIEFVDSQIKKEHDEYEIEEYEDYKKELLVKLAKREESWSKARVKVTEGIERNLFDPMTKAHLLSFEDEEHQAESAKQGDLRALRRLGRSENINPTYLHYYILGHKMGFKKSTQKLATIHIEKFESLPPASPEKREAFKRAVKYASKAYVLYDHFGDTSGSSCFLHNRFSHPPLEWQKTEVPSLPAESISPIDIEQFEELIAYVGYLKGVYASTYKDSTQNKCLENSAGIALDILNKYRKFFEKLSRIPGLLIPVEFYYPYEETGAATGRNIEMLALAFNQGRVPYKTDGIYYTINGEKYTSMVWKKYLDLLEPTVLDVDQKVMQKEFNKLLKYTEKALALLGEDKLDLSQALLTLSLTSESNEHGRSLYSFLFPFLGDGFNELSTEDQKMTRARAIEPIREMRANLKHHINVVNDFKAYFLRSIEQMRGQLQRMLTKTFRYLYGA